MNAARQLGRGVSRAASAAVVLIACLVLLGWALEIRFLMEAIPGLPAMNPSTAVGLILAAVSLLLLEAEPSSRSIRRSAQFLALLVTLMGAVKVGGYALGHDFGIDRLLFSRMVEEYSDHPGRMAPVAALIFILAGFALLLLDVEGRRGQRPAQYPAIAAGLLSIGAILGYAYGAAAFYGLESFIPMAFHSAIAFMLLSVAILFARPEQGLMAIITSDSSAGILVRRLLPAVIVIPSILGGLILARLDQPPAQIALRVTLVTLANIVVFIALVWWNARLLNRAEVRRLQVEDELRKSEAFYHSLVETLPQHIFRKDRDGRFTFGNQRFCADLGIPLEQIVGRTDLDFYPAPLAEKYRRDDQQVLETGRPLEAIEEHPGPDGQTLYVQVIKTPVHDSAGRIIGTQGIYWDVTERKRWEWRLEEKNVQLAEAAASEREAHDALKKAQSQLVQAEKLAALGQMVAGIAHEINNPLSFVGNNVAVLQRDMQALRELLELYQQGEDALHEQRPELMGRIAAMSQRLDLRYTLENMQEIFARSREGLRRIQQIVNDLRDFARLDERDLHEVDLNAGIESTVNIVRSQARQKNVQLELDLGRLPLVTCYPAKINQVVMNLLSNAIDATAEGGIVTVRTRAEDQQVCIEVADTGRGIPPAVRERIFDPFFTTKPPGQGTGLGLSISYGIVRDHGGQIDVKSEPGTGSRFTVCLPVRCGLSAFPSGG